MPNPMTTPPDDAFERQLADLAYYALQSRSPGLVNHVVGFQVLDTNEEHTRAMGIFGCKMGKEWIYLPAFYLNGEVKGTELLYLKQHDLFLPNQENWVTYILQRKTIKLGEGSAFTRKDTSSPDLRPYWDSPSSAKRASHQAAEAVAALPSASPDFHCGPRVPCWTANHPQPWAADMVGALRPHMEKLAGNTPVETLSDLTARLLDPVVSNYLDVIRHAGPSTARALTTAMAKNASFATSVLTFSPLDAILGLDNTGYVPTEGSRRVELTRSGRRVGPATVRDYADGSVLIRPLPKQASEWKASPDVEVISPHDNPSALDESFTEADRRQLARGELVVRDNRKNTTSVYRAEVPMAFQEPNETGLYSMADKQGDVHTVLVAMNPLTPQGRECLGASDWRYGRKTHVLVVEISTGKFDVFPIDRLAAVRARDGERPKATVAKLGAGDRVVIWGRDNEVLGPVRIMARKEMADGNVELLMTGYMGKSYDTLDPSMLPRLIMEKGDGLLATSERDVFFVGRDANVIKLADDSGGILPVNVDDLLRGLWMGGKTVPMKIHGNGTEYDITAGVLKSAGALPHRQALDHLIRDHGIRGQDALQLLKEARVASSKHSALKVLLRYAPGYPDLYAKSADIAPAWPGENQAGSTRGGVPTQTTQTLALPATDTATSKGNQSVYNSDMALDDTTMTLAQGAAASGQKEVFDAAMLTGLVKNVDAARLVDKYLGDMILGMDRVGRTYFLFLQHYDVFADRYGRDDLMELEDSLRNTFQTMGDLIMFLKQKKVQGGPSVSDTEAPPQ